MYVLFLLLISLSIMTKVESSNWVVIVNTSRYWFNYRHLTNALSVYSIVKKLGINDDHIIFMNAFDYACDSRNIIPGRIYYNKNHNDVRFDHDSNNDNDDDLYKNVEIDYKGNQVLVSKFMDIMIGNHDTNDPDNGKLQSNSNSTILLYLSGHGGDEFLKFQDIEELTAQDIGIMVKEMERRHRYKQLLIIADTCQASTLANQINSTNVVVITSSKKGENSYAYHISELLGVSLIDRFTYRMYQFFNSYIFNNDHDDDNASSKMMTLQHLLDFMDYRFLHSTANMAINTGYRSLNSIPIIEFFGNTMKKKYSIIDTNIIPNFDSDTSNITIDECHNIRINEFQKANFSITNDNSSIDISIVNTPQLKATNDHVIIVINLLVSILLCLILIYIRI